MSNYTVKLTIAGMKANRSVQAPSPDEAKDEAVKSVRNALIRGLQGSGFKEIEDDGVHLPITVESVELETISYTVRTRAYVDYEVEVPSDISAHELEDHVLSQLGPSMFCETETLTIERDGKQEDYPTTISLVEPELDANDVKTIETSRIGMY